MSKEENIALKTLKEVASDDFDTLGDDISPKMAQNILNVIDKQQKEIEELKSITREYKAFNGAIDDKIIIADDRYFNNGYFKNSYIPKQKIREKIKEYREETMRCQECKDYEDANINQQILLAFDELLEEK